MTWGDVRGPGGLGRRRSWGFRCSSSNLKIGLSEMSEQTILPFFSLTAESVRHIKHGATVIRCMKRFMSFVETLGRENTCWGDRKASSPIGWDLSAVKALWGGIQKDFKINTCIKNRERERFPGELSTEK